MHEVFNTIIEELSQLIISLKTIGGNDPLNVAHSLWNAPGYTRQELIQITEDLISIINERGTEKITIGETLVADYQRRLAFLRANTIPQIWGGNAGAAISAFIITMQGLKTALENSLPPLDLADTIAKAVGNARTATNRLRALEIRINNLDPRFLNLAEMLDRIEKANVAADQLPIDLEALKDAQEIIRKSLETVTGDQNQVSIFVTSATVDRQKLEKLVLEGEAIVARCSSAYAASTSHGLAAAFTERSAALGKSMWVWVTGLVVALTLGSCIGSTQLHSFSELIKQPGSNPTYAVINLVLALLSVGATVWFSWLATKQIGQRFRLAEDYAFKASVSRAYEGYRREAANIDQEFVSRLFSSALSRLDEQPLRLVETTTPGSPWHELMSSKVVQKAAASVPQFAEFVIQFAKDGLASKKNEKSFSPIEKPVE